MTWEEAVAKSGGDIVGGQVIVFHEGAHILLGTYAAGVFTTTDVGDRFFVTQDATFVPGAPDGPGDVGAIALPQDVPANPSTQVQPVRSDAVDPSSAIDALLG
jgi:hypothetical protein